MYFDFLNDLGIELTHVKHKFNKISKWDYPELIHVDKPNFNSFVAYDFETTGLSDIKDSPIEIGAIKVINGEVVESKDFIFQELIKPYRAKISPKITELTGITPEDVKESREMWDVMYDFF